MSTELGRQGRWRVAAAALGAVTSLLIPLGCAASTPSVAGDNRETVGVVVEGVKTLSMQTYPVRIMLVVSGRRVPDVPVEVKQERRGDEIVVTLTQAAPAGTEGARESFEQRVTLEGGFASGRYKLRVNDFATEFEV